MWSWEELQMWWAMLNSMPEFSAGEKPVAEVEVFRGVSDGKRTDAVMAEVYDAEFAEMIADHMAEKCRNRKHYNAKMYAKAQSQVYRNRSGKKCKNIPTRGHDADRGYWQNWRAYCEFKSRVEWKQDDRERSLRKDWAIEEVEIEEELYWQAVKAEIRRWEAEAKAEQERCRRERQQIEESRKLHEWLKWA